MKPKQNRATNDYTPHGMDACQTPAYAVKPILPYLRDRWTIWEPACGEGLLVKAMPRRLVIPTDILTGQNFFTFEPARWDAIVTNPPFSIKYRWLQRCYSLGKPFALLMPVETLGAKQAQILFVEYGVELMFLDTRIDFKMPLAGWEGSCSQFPVMWVCWKVLPKPIMFESVAAEKRRFKQWIASGSSTPSETQEQMRFDMSARQLTLPNV